MGRTNTAFAARYFSPAGGFCRTGTPSASNTRSFTNIAENRVLLERAGIYKDLGAVFASQVRTRDRKQRVHVVFQSIWQARNGLAAYVAGIVSVFGVLGRSRGSWRLGILFDGNVLGQKVISEVRVLAELPLTGGKWARDVRLASRYIILPEFCELVD